MWLLCGVLWAQEPDPAKKPTDPPNQQEEARTISKLPQVLATVPVSYPDKALTDGFGGVVLLNLSITEDGEVVQAEIAESLRPDMDAAAIEAILKYTFSPALDQDGKPTPCLVQYRFLFEPTVVAPPSVEGVILEAGKRTPLANIKVVAMDSQGVTFYQSTEADGSFRFRGLTDGKWTIMASGRALAVKTTTVQVQPDKIANVRLYLVRDQAESNRFDYELVVEDRVETAEVTERFISGDDISYLPGSGGDIVRAIQNLPGIARSPFGIGLLIIRGTGPSNSRYYLDGVQIPSVFHFGGLTTVISSNSIEEVAYIPGNYSVRYGRQLSGLVDLRTKSSMPEEDIGEVSVDIFQSELYIQNKVNDNLAVSISGRRSYADIILNPIVENYGFSVRLPRYYDAQVGVLYKPNASNTIDAFYLFSDDQFKFLGENAEENTDQFSFRDSFHKLRIRWEREMANNWKMESSFITGPDTTRFVVGEEATAVDLLWSAQWRHEFSKSPDVEGTWGFRFGIDTLGGRNYILYDIPDIEIEETEYNFAAPAIYSEVTKDIGNLRAIIGLRSDTYFQGNDVFIWGIDPRLTLRYAIGDYFNVNTSVGIFSQFPPFAEVDSERGGNPDLEEERAIQYAMGFDYEFSTALSWDVVGYYSDLTDLVIGSGSGIQFGDGPPREGDDDNPYRNEGGGRTYGVESLLTYKQKNLLVLLATTFSRSERLRNNGEYRLFGFDQPFVINGLFTWQLPQNQRLGARIRYGAGNPFTPVINRIYDLDSRSFRAINGERNSQRLDSFFSLDVRYDKTFVFDRWKLTTYLDIQNVTNNGNVEIMTYNEDYSEERPITGLPVFPALGIKGEW